jgi:putative PEP-CTERM system TPR-repeat lipoprotein
VRGLAELAAGDADSARGSAETAERLAPKLPEAIMLDARAAIAQQQPGWALELLDRVLVLNPRLTEALLLKAGILRAEGDPAAALPVLDAAVAAAPNAVNPRLSRAAALLAEGEDAKALVDLDALLSHAPHSPAGNYLKAVALVRARDWHGADTVLQAIQPLLPRLPRGEYYLALVKANLNQMEQANEAIGHYTARVPNDPDGWRLLARIDLLAGRRDDAMAALARAGGGQGNATDQAALENVANNKPADAPATPRELTQLASLQIGNGDAVAAERDLERSLETLPTPADLAARTVTTALRAGDIDAASAGLATLQQTPKADPVRVAALSGAVKVAQLDLDGARAAFTEGLRLAPDSLTLKADLARVLALQGRTADAMALLTPTLAKAPANPTALATALDILEAAGDNAQAATVLAAARAAQPDNAGLLLLQVSLQARRGDIAGALTTLDGAPADLGQTPRLLATRARLLLAAGKPADAITALRQILIAAPRSLDVRHELVDLLLATGQGDAAVALARDGLALAPGNSVLLQTYVGATYRVSGLDAALALADTLRRDPTNLPASRLLKGALYMAAKQPADAARAFAAESATAPFGALVIAEAGALRAAGNLPQARAKLTAWVAQQPDPAASDVLASVDIEEKRLDAAAAALHDVLAARPDDPVALNNLAWVDQQQKDDKAALALARRAYLIAPGGQTADTLGWILTRQGEVATGLLLLRQAAGRLPADPAVHYHLAVALNDTGQHADAAAVLKAILAQKTSFDERAAAEQLQLEIAAGAGAK